MCFLEFSFVFLKREEEGAWNLVGREGRKDLQRVREGKRHDHNILYKKKSSNKKTKQRQRREKYSYQA